MTLDATLKDMGRASPQGFLLTDALLLMGLRVGRDVAMKIFRGVRAMQDSDTYLMILDEGQEKRAKKISCLLAGNLWGKRMTRSRLV